MAPVTTPEAMTPEAMTPEAVAPEASPASVESPLRSVLSVVTTVGPPLTVATALMIYFGWARSDTQARFMGLDVSLFGFSTQDYVLQSISTLYIPILAVASLALAGLALHQRIECALPRPSARALLRGAGRVAFAAGLLSCATAVVVASRDPTRASLVVPLALAVGTAVAAYGAWLARAAGDHGTRGAGPPPWQRALRTVLVGTVVTLALFWEMSVYAGVVGRGYAQQLAATVSQLPRATAFSTAPLGIEAPGVREERIPAATPAVGATPRYRTTGLRFLTTSGGRIFLVHDGWRPGGGGVVIVLPDNDQIRWQFSR